MKISYRTHPALKYLEDKNLNKVQVFQCDVDGIKEVFDIFNRLFEVMANRINNKCYYASQNFLDAYEKAGDSLYKSNLWGEVESDDFCLLLPSGQCTMVHITNNTERGIIGVENFDFLKGTIGANNTVFIHYKDDFHVSRMGWKSKNIKEENHILNCVLITLFIKYAKPEIKELKAGQKIKEIECKYINETKTNIKEFNVLWFTTLIKSDGFDVRGHFRLQPKKKNGEWTKEMIWINPFKKTGYTRKAGKLLEEENR